MALCDDCFEDFLHPLVHESMEKNQRFEKKYGRHERWDWDADASTLTFSNSGRARLRIHVSIVGTTQGHSWQWSWANKNIPPYSKLDMEKVREFGEVNGFERLTSKFLDADEHTGWEMTAIAAHLLDAPGAYRFPTDAGYCYLVYRAIEEVGADGPRDLHGAILGSIQVAPSVDLAESADEALKAESGLPPDPPALY